MTLSVVVVSAVSEAYGIQQARASNRATLQVMTTVVQSGERVVITDIWYVPPVIAPVFNDGHPVYLIGSGNELDTLLTTLRSANISSIYLGTRSDMLLKASSIGRSLVPTSAPQPLPFNLIGGTYRFTPY